MAGSPPHLAHVLFRDHLRTHPDIAEAYASLKREVAARYANDLLGYTDAKSELVERVLADARPA